MSDPDFEASQVDTLFVDSKLESLLESKEDSADWIYRASAISCFLEDSLQAEKNAQNAFDPWSPWNKLSNWRVGGCEPYRVQLRNHKGEETEINFACDKNTFKIINAKEHFCFSNQKRDLLELNWIMRIRKNQAVICLFFIMTSSYCLQSTNMAGRFLPDWTHCHLKERSFRRVPSFGANARKRNSGACKSR